MQEKEKSVLHFSHCAVKFREEYAQNMVGSGTKIDMYGRCTKPDPCKNRNKCTVEMYQKYKFYLAFENIHCFDYIAENAWKSLLYGMVPIINGAPLESCKYHLPPNYLLHVDNFTSPKEVSEYIEYLESNDDVYLRYHEWRKEYVVVLSEFPDLQARMICKSAVQQTKTKIINKSQWWNVKSQCG